MQSSSEWVISIYSHTLTNSHALSDCLFFPLWNWKIQKLSQKMQKHKNNINNNNNKCVMNVSQFQDVSVFFFQAGFITFCWNLHSLWFFIFTFQPAKDWRGSLHSWWQPSLQGHWTRNPLEKSDWPAVLTQRMLSQQGGTGQNTWPACSTKGCS